MFFNRYFYILILSPNGQMGGCGSDRMVVEFTTTCAITTKVVSSNPVHDMVYLIQHYVITSTRSPPTIFIPRHPLTISSPCMTVSPPTSGVPVIIIFL